MRFITSAVVFFTSVVLVPVFAQLVANTPDYYTDIVHGTISPCDVLRTDSLFELLCKGRILSTTKASVRYASGKFTGVDGGEKLPANDTIEERPFWYPKIPSDNTGQDENDSTADDNVKDDRNQTDLVPLMPKVAARAANEVSIPEPPATILPLSNCRDSGQFLPCEYFVSCFGNKLQECGRRDSFLGDDAQKLCVYLNGVAGGHSPKSYSDYIYSTLHCVATNLEDIVEFPTCDDITFSLETSIFSSNTSSCLFQTNFCDLMKEKSFVETIASAFEPGNSDPTLVQRLVPAFFELIDDQCDDHSKSNFATYVIDKLNQPTSEPSH